MSGRTGSLLWALSGAGEALVRRSNMYTPQPIRDVDADGTSDLLVSHGGDPLREPGASGDRLAGRLLVVSGRSGQLLSWATVPDGRESYYSPQLLVYPDGSELVLFGTGGETHGGSLWSLPLRELLAGRADTARALYTDPNKGVMTPPALVDLTGDGVEDIVMAAFNSTAFALDGVSFARLWSHRFAQSESYSTPAVGFFDGDSTPDVMVSYQTGPGFPLYVSSQTTVLDGRTGRPLLARPVKAALGAQASPLAVSMPGRGHDFFLYWLSDCHRDGSLASDDQFDLAAGTSVFLRSRADFCRLRFNSRLYTRLYALSADFSSPGVLIYDSGEFRISGGSTMSSAFLDGPLLPEQMRSGQSSMEGCPISRPSVSASWSSTRSTSGAAAATWVRTTQAASSGPYPPVMRARVRATWCPLAHRSPSQACCCRGRVRAAWTSCSAPSGSTRAACAP